MESHVDQTQPPTFKELVREYEEEKLAEEGEGILSKLANAMAHPVETLQTAFG